MTLVKRLFIVFLIGLAGLVGYLKVGEPALRRLTAGTASGPATATASSSAAPAEIYGEYRASTQDGHYVLVLAATGAEMRYTDKHRKEFAYRGRYEVNGPALSVVWDSQRQGSTWAAMQAYPDKMSIVSHDRIAAGARVFERVPAKG
ncbi:TPA: hypothetical protein ACK3Q6_007671 [Burkholderia cepacia]